MPCYELHRHLQTGIYPPQTYTYTIKNKTQIISSFLVGHYILFMGYDDYKYTHHSNCIPGSNWVEEINWIKIKNIVSQIKTFVWIQQ